MCLGLPPLLSGAGIDPALLERAQAGATLAWHAALQRALIDELLYDDLSPVPVQEGELAGMALHYSGTRMAANPVVHEVLLRRCWRLFAWLIGGRVRVHLQQTQPAWPDLDHTARALNLSASTLQRQLAAEGTSFQTLKDHLRRDIAIYRLTTSTVALATLASELGFADSFAFQRAFKGWTGCPPGAYRRSLR